MVFLDLDGVLVDFTGGLIKRLGPPKTPVDRWECWDCWGITIDEFWNTCSDREFWANLDWTEDGKEILDLVTRSYSEIYIATSPSLSACSLAGKMDWLAREMPKFKRRYFMTPHKHLLAGPGRTLIDDSDSNCEKFQASGGRSILVPRSWNGNRGYTDTVSYIKARIDCETF